MTQPFDYSHQYLQWHDASSEHADAMARDLAALLAPLLPENRDASVLDVGCGMGFAMLAAGRLGFRRVYGVEQDPGQFEAARAHGLDVELTDDTTAWLTGRRGAYDVILLLDVLEHIPRSEVLAFLQALRSALAPGGHVVLSTPNANSPVACRYRYLDFTHVTSHTESSLIFLARNAGFRTVDVVPTRLGRPPLRLWRTQARAQLRRWVVRRIWMWTLRAELGPDLSSGIVSIDPNLLAVLRT